MYPAATAQNVAADLGAPLRTVENWITFGAAPSWRWIGPILSVYGPEFLAAVMDAPPCWLVEAKRNAQRERLAREIRDLEIEITEAALG